MTNPDYPPGRPPPADEPSLVRPFLAGGHSEDRSGRRRAQAPTVRPYLLTGGRSRPSEATLAVEAQVLSTEAGLAALPGHRYEHYEIIDLCREPIAVVEVAGRLGLHLGVARVLVGDLVAIGHLSVRGLETGRHRDTQIIERVIRGLQAIH